MKRFFLVGCPRSGTTLLQSMLAGHPEVYTLPETHFFQKISGRLPPKAPVVSPRAASRVLDTVAMSLRQTAVRPRVPRWWLGRGRYAEALIALLDHAAMSASKSIWLEKSPVHLHYQGEIASRVPGVAFVHLLRDGRDVVASLVDVASKDPSRWVPQLLGRGGVRWNRSSILEAAVRRWNSDLEASLDRIGDASHLLVTYERLIEDPVSVLSMVCGFMGIRYHPDMAHHREIADEVIGWRRQLPHMKAVFAPLQDYRLARFRATLSVDEQRAVTSGLLFGGNPRTALQVAFDQARP